MLSHPAGSDSLGPRDAARQAPLSVEFSRQEYRSGLPFPSPGDLLECRDQTQVFCLGWQILYHLIYQGSPGERVEGKKTGFSATRT